MRFSFEASGRDFSGVCATVRALVSQRLLIAFAPAQPMHSGLTRKRVRYRSVPAGRGFTLTRGERYAPSPAKAAHFPVVTRGWVVCFLVGPPHANNLWWARFSDGNQRAQPSHSTVRRAQLLSRRYFIVASRIDEPLGLASLPFLRPKLARLRFASTSQLSAPP